MTTARDVNMITSPDASMSIPPDVDTATSHATAQSTAWLPSKHEPPLLDGPLTVKYIKEHKANDWFLTLHDAMPQTYEAWMMAKVYIFLRQYMPEGLTGRWAHLRGSEVMKVLLSDGDVGEQCASRHKATKKIYPSLGKLKDWMAKGHSWQIALENSKVEAKKMKAHAARRKQLERAPMPLYVPERCLAILVLGYPDRKYRDMFQRLHVEWMMDDPKALNVQGQGFWCGLDSRAVSSVFLQAKPLPATEATNCGLDYDVLFGASFPRCREDIRPYLPSEEWAQGLCLGTRGSDKGTVDSRPADDHNAYIIPDSPMSSDVDTEEADEQGSRGLSSAISPTATAIGKGACSGDGGDGGASTAASSAEVSSAPKGLSGPANTWSEAEISPHLSVDDESDGALPGWLAHLLDQHHDTFTVVRTWCCFWEKQMSAAKTAEEQLLTRSLLLQSARSIRSFHTSSATAAADAYMLLDIGAWDRLSEDHPESQTNLARIPQFAAYSTAKSRFIQLLGSANEDAAILCGKIFSRQAEYFYSTQRDRHFFRYAKDCMRLAEIRLLILCRGFVPGSTPALPQHSRLWDSTVLSALQVSHWQALAVMQPAADLRSILTVSQFQIYNENYRAKGRALPMKDLSRKPVLSLQSYKGDCQEKDRDILTALFGVLEPQAQNQSAPLASVPNAIRLAKVSGQPDSPPRESEQLVTASGEVEARSQLQPPQTPRSSAKSNNSKKRHFSALHPKQDKNPYVPQSPKRGGKNERSTNVPPLGCWSDKPEKEQPATSSAGNDRNPYAKAIQSSTARPLKVVPRESVLREEVKGLKEKVDVLLESQGRIREETAQILEEKLESKTQAIVSTVESRLESFFTLHTKTLTRTIIDCLEQHKKGHDASLDKLAQTINENLVTWTGKQLVQLNQQVITTINERSLKRKEVDETMVQRMESKFDEIKAILSKVPSVGQEGYLAHHCHTSTMAPAAYEHALVRAAIFYFNLFPDADSPVVKDYTAMEETMDHYPELVPEHIDMAIDHLHFIAYGHTMAEREGSS
ncbi:hypothetical protein F5Y07DRAFT_408060 [Xylaria sp. FL0933]|nr:hypothetical protein F5Y07DRAFT_408060 [Xylaria sp. FL0933]